METACGCRVILNQLINESGLVVIEKKISQWGSAVGTDGNPHGLPTHHVSVGQKRILNQEAHKRNDCVEGEHMHLVCVNQGRAFNEDYSSFSPLKPQLLHWDIT